MEERSLGFMEPTQEELIFSGYFAYRWARGPASKMRGNGRFVRRDVCALKNGCTALPAIRATPSGRRVRVHVTNDVESKHLVLGQFCHPSNREHLVECFISLICPVFHTACLSSSESLQYRKSLPLGCVVVHTSAARLDGIRVVQTQTNVGSL